MSKKQRLNKPARVCPSEVKIADRALSTSWVTMFSLGVATTSVLALAIAAVSQVCSTPERRLARNNRSQIVETQTLLSLEQICNLPDVDLNNFDLAELNLICLEGLPGCENVDQGRCSKVLHQYADSVRAQTESNLHRFYADPSSYRNSEAYFRMLMLVTVLQQDYGVRYNPDRITDVDYRIPADLFIHGLLGYGHGGTCVSIPTLYAAVAQRLGYPVSLVHAKEHLFCRWDGESDRFNIEGTNQGMSVYSDGHYLNWPHPIEQAEVDSGQYLKTLDKRECLAVFVAMRAHCFEDRGDTGVAMANYRQAIALAPAQHIYQLFLKQISRNRMNTMLERLQGEHSQQALFGPPVDQLTPLKHVITASDIKQLSDSGFKF